MVHKEAVVSCSQEPCDFSRGRFRFYVVKKVHPTEKPIPLLEYLLKTYTKENEWVLDSCMGSGTTGVAALKNDRNFIGIEIDESYYKIAEQRIKEIVMR